MTETRKLRVFLCHSSQDKPIVRELYQRLSAEGWIDPWLDEEKLLPGQDWDIEIEKVVEKADAVIVCLSNHSVTKEGYVQKELRSVLDVAEYKPEGAIFIIPILLDSCQLPRRLKNYQYQDYFTDTTHAYKRLCSSLETRANLVGIDIDAIKENVRRQERERLNREREEQIRREAEERIFRDEVDIIRQSAEEKARRSLERKFRKQANEKARQEREEQVRKEADEQARLEIKEYTFKEREKEERKEVEKKSLLEKNFEINTNEESPHVLQDINRQEPLGAVEAFGKPTEPYLTNGEWVASHPPKETPNLFSSLVGFLKDTILDLSNSCISIFIVIFSIFSSILWCAVPIAFTVVSMNFKGAVIGLVFMIGYLIALIIIGAIPIIGPITFNIESKIFVVFWLELVNSVYIRFDISPFVFLDTDPIVKVMAASSNILVWLVTFVQIILIVTGRYRKRSLKPII